MISPHPFRIGQGYDVHQLKEGRPMVLGGIDIPNPFGPDGHSDADVLLHALCDALLGAIGQRDIGHHYPNTDDRWKGADSTQLLKDVFLKVKQAQYQVWNADITLILEAPKIGKYVQAMKERISSLLEVLPDDIAIKATTAEKLGFVGRGEGIEAFATVLLGRVSA